MSLLAPTPHGSIGCRGLKEGLFISHQVSNAKQCMNSTNVHRAVKAQISTLGTSYLDLKQY
eukprot:11725341-Ditylum_brightwellii.AAC.1